MAETALQGTHNKVTRDVFSGTDIAMTSFWNATVEMWDFHRDIIDGRGHECSHYCFGGVPQVSVTLHDHAGYTYFAATECRCQPGMLNISTPSNEQAYKTWGSIDVLSNMPGVS